MLKRSTLASGRNCQQVFPAVTRSIRVLNVVDAYTRESLAMEVDTSFAGLRVTRVLDQIIDERGLPLAIRCDNDPELASRTSLPGKIDLLHIQPGKPTQNGYVESFNSKLREECLCVSWFQNLFETRRIIADWRREYNESRHTINFARVNVRCWRA